MSANHGRVAVDGEEEATTLEEGRSPHRLALLDLLLLLVEMGLDGFELSLDEDSLAFGALRWLEDPSVTVLWPIRQRRRVGGLAMASCFRASYAARRASRGLASPLEGWKTNAVGANSQISLLRTAALGEALRHPGRPAARTAPCPVRGCLHLALAGQHVETAAVVDKGRRPHP